MLTQLQSRGVLRHAEPPHWLQAQSAHPRRCANGTSGAEFGMPAEKNRTCC